MWESAWRVFIAGNVYSANALTQEFVKITFVITFCVILTVSRLRCWDYVPAIVAVTAEE